MIWGQYFSDIPPRPLAPYRGQGGLATRLGARGPPGLATSGLRRQPNGLRAQGAMPKRCHGLFMQERLAALGKELTKMKKLLLAAAMLTAATQAHASCRSSLDLNGSLVTYWQQKEITAKANNDQQAMFPQNRPILDAMTSTLYARVIADSVLCEQNAISVYEYRARVLETFTRMGR